MEAYIGTILAFAGNTIPYGWLECNGQQLDVVNYDALYRVIGYTYGRGPNNSFNLPDLRGRVIMGVDLNPQTQNKRVQGDACGSNTMSLNVGNLPAHSHSLIVSEGLNNTNTPGSTAMFGKWQGNVTIPDGNGGGGMMGTNVDGQSFTSDVLINKTTLSPLTISSTGQGQSFDIVQPSLVCKYIICTIGFFPSTNLPTRVLVPGQEFETKSFKIHTRNISVGASNNKKKIIRIDNPYYGTKYGIKPTIQIRNSEEYSDVFASSIMGDYFSEYFQVAICRIDGDSWAQSLFLTVIFNVYQIQE